MISDPAFLADRFLPLFSTVVLVAAAIFDYSARPYVLIGLLLLLPFLDARWHPPAPLLRKRNLLAWAALVLAGIAIVIWQPAYLGVALSALLVAALPEEWFFRGYFMGRLGKGWQANIPASLLFSLLHGLTLGWPAALRVFLPSLFFGWLYQRTGDLVLIILIHALSNLMYVAFLSGYLEAILAKFM